MLQEYRAIKDKGAVLTGTVPSQKHGCDER
jgi:hypothetical protein